MVGTPIPALAALVMGMSRFWCSLKGFLLQLLLACLGPVRGNPKKIYQSVLSCLSFPTVIHLGV